MTVIKNYKFTNDDSESSSNKLMRKPTSYSIERNKVMKGTNLSEKKYQLKKIKKIEFNEEKTKTDLKTSTKKNNKLEPETKTESQTIEQLENENYRQGYVDEEEYRQDYAFKRKQVDQDIQQYKVEKTSQIETEKKRILDNAYREGIEKGKIAGEEALQEKSQELLRTINSVIEDKNKILKNARGEILRLAMKIAEQILKSEISLNQAVCVNIVSEAISKITDKDRVIIKVNRADADFVRANKDRILSHMSDVKNLAIQEDPRIEQGGCIIETKMGYIDSTVSTKLESIEKAIFKVYEEERLEDEGLI